MKAVIKRILGEPLLGAIEFVRFPKMRAEWGGPFNGQPLRQALFRNVIKFFRPSALIETGAYRGATTEFFAVTGLPVYSIEANPRSYGFTRARLWHRHNVHLILGDSRRGLRELFGGSLRPLLRSNLFFYLDAHWSEDLPLLEELELIVNECSSALIMIDDFKVPDESNYGFDDYGPGKALTLDLIKPVVAKRRLAVYFPSVSADDEGGEKRGCVVLAQHTLSGAALYGLRTIAESPIRETAV
jgi:hypothetical protein